MEKTDPIQIPTQGHKLYKKPGEHDVPKATRKLWPQTPEEG